MKIMSMRSWLRGVGYRLGQVREQLGLVAPLSEEDYQEVEDLLPTTAAISLFRTMSPADQQHSLRVCRRLKTRGCSDVDMLAAALLHDVGKAEGRVPFWTRPAIVLGKKLAPQLLMRLVAYPNTDESPAFTDRLLRPSKGGRSGVDGRGGLHRPSSPRGVGISQPGDASVPSPHLYHSRPYETSRLLKRLERTVGAPINGAPTVRSIAYSIILFVTIIVQKSRSTINRWIAPLTKWRLALGYAWYHAEVGADLALTAGLSERAVLYIRTHHRSDGPAAELHEVDEVS